MLFRSFGVRLIGPSGPVALFQEIVVLKFSGDFGLRQAEGRCPESPLVVRRKRVERAPAKVSLTARRMLAEIAAHPGECMRDR